MLPDPLTPETLEQFRRSLAMLGQGQPSGLDREAAMQLIEELQRHEGADRRLGEMVEALRDLLERATPK
jgi:phytoene/squalene synthetase